MLTHACFQNTLEKKKKRKKEREVGMSFYGLFDKVPFSL